MASPSAAERGRQVRRRLLSTAADLIPELGWMAVSTRVLADRAGVAPGLVHYHFASLQALLAEAALGRIRELLDGLGQLLEGAATPEELLETMTASLDGFSGRDPMSLLFVETYLAAARDEELRAAAGAVVDDFRALLTRLLAEHGVAAPHETASVFMATVDGLMLHRALTPDLTAASLAPVLRRMF